MNDVEWKQYHRDVIEDGVVLLLKSYKILFEDWIRRTILKFHFILEALQFQQLTLNSKC
jgi:hypothetical protein